MKILKINIDIKNDPPTKAEINDEKIRIEREINLLSIVSYVLITVAVAILLCGFVVAGEFADSFSNSYYGLGFAVVVIIIILLFIASDCRDKKIVLVEKGRMYLLDFGTHPEESSSAAETVLSICQNYSICRQYAEKVAAQGRTLTFIEANSITEWPEIEKNNQAKEEQIQNREQALQKLQHLHERG